MTGQREKCEECNALTSAADAGQQRWSSRKISMTAGVRMGSHGRAFFGSKRAMASGVRRRPVAVQFANDTNYGTSCSHERHDEREAPTSHNLPVYIPAGAHKAPASSRCSVSSWSSFCVLLRFLR
jgi:hypothetical protein